MGGKMNKKMHPFINLPPIDKNRLMEIMKYLVGVPGNTTSLDYLAERFGIHKSKTEKLLNTGIEQGLLDIKICPVTSLTEQGKRYLNRNQS